MRRRNFIGLVGSAGALSLAGCSGVFGDSDDGSDDDQPVDPKSTDKAASNATSGATPPADRPATEAPAECPVSTIPEHSPPAKPTRKAVESFIRTYEEAYMLEEQFLSYEDQLTEATILSADQTEYGYTVEAQFSGADVYLQAAIHAEPDSSGVDPPDSSVLDSQALVDAAKRAAEEDTGVVERLSPPRGATEAETLPRQLQKQVAALPGDEAGGYVTVDGTAVRLRVDVREVHADYFTYSVLYYVDSRVVRRQYLPDADAVAQEAELVECREPPT